MNGWIVLPVLAATPTLSGRCFSEDGMQVDGYLNSDAFKKAMQWYSDIHNVDMIAPKGTSASDSNGLFMAGKIVFLTGNVFNYNTFSKTEGLNWGYIPSPLSRTERPLRPPAAGMWG